MSQHLTFGFYGDDFTGSTDALEFACRSGLRTVLFIEPPTRNMLEQFPDLEAVGVAGSTRAMAPDEMDKVLRRDLALMKDVGIELVHYKTCSTFDSSSTVGSIGKAIEVGSEVFGNRVVLVVAGAPHLSRYCVFGNLYARMGIGSDADIYRLDRHPVMRHHPVTPATESDLRIVLAQQCDRSVDLLNLKDLESPQLHLLLDRKIEEGADVIVTDGMTEADMQRVGKLISEYESGKQRFIVGSSGVEYALGLNRETPPQKWETPKEVETLLVISGSCSEVTESQIHYALQHGVAEVALQTEQLFISETAGAAEIRRCQQSLKTWINEGRDVIVHSVVGKSDPRLKKTRLAALENGIAEGDFEKTSGKIIGEALGKIATAGLQVERMVVAGGDSSSYAARAMGIEAVEMTCPLVPGAPLCRVVQGHPSILGCEVNFKGGQVGTKTYFAELKKGRLADGS